jgi:fido (protein-threonine AMPylation protein)
VPTAWEDDPADAPRIAANAAAVLAGIASTAGAGTPPTVAMAQQWHRDLYDGIARPFPYYAGEVRDSDPAHPDLIGYEVQVGSMAGVPSALVPQALEQFEDSAKQAVVGLDADVGAGPPSETLQLHGVLTLCAVLHGEWIRIHPFANGNGRTARLWANWAALRYGLPPFVTIKPRPSAPYGMAAFASMTGGHQMMVGVMRQMLDDYLRSLR